MPNSSIENEKMYEDLREQGNSREKAARISSDLTKSKLIDTLRNH